MNVISPNNHEAVFKISGKGLSLLEREIFKCTAVIYKHGGHGDRDRFVKIHYDVFVIPN